MSAYTTLRITRQTTINIALQQLLNGISNETLEQQLDDMLRDRLYNVSIVGEGMADDDNYIKHLLL